MDRPEDYSLLDPAVQECPYAAYAAMRRDAPVYRMPETGYYVITRYQDVREALRLTDVFSNDFDTRVLSPRGQPPEVVEIYSQHGWERKRVLQTDPPDHTRYRRLVDRAFTAGRVRAMEPYIDALVHELIDEWIGDGEVEFISRFANPLPMKVIADRLGVPREDAALFKRWSDASVDSIAISTPPERQVECAWQLVEMQQYFVPLFEQRRRAPQQDILSDIVTARLEDGRMLAVPELLDLVEQLLTGGNETTTHALGAGMLLLIEHPHLVGRIRADIERLKIFVEEVLRLESPTQGTFRQVRRDVELSGVTIPAGSMVNLRYGAANRDEQMFPEPATLDLDRPNAGAHLAFISGIHHCLGAPLARQEMICAFRALLDRLEGLRLTEDRPPPHMPNFMMRGLTRLPIAFGTRK
ncbi:MAG: cytochrome P450 [Alphaproteobacteria bacterium]|nr:cytochrome P450 [Alphaproteobacteria bacterium]